MWQQEIACEDERSSTRKKQAASGLQADRLRAILYSQPAFSLDHAVALDDVVIRKATPQCSPALRTPVT